MKPESDVEGHDPFKEGALESGDDGCADSEGVELSEQVEPLVTPLENFLCVGKEF